MTCPICNDAGEAHGRRCPACAPLRRSICPICDERLVDCSCARKALLRLVEAARVHRDGRIVRWHAVDGQYASWLPEHGAAGKMGEAWAHALRVLGDEPEQPAEPTELDMARAETAAVRAVAMQLLAYLARHDAGGKGPVLEQWRRRIDRAGRDIQPQDLVRPAGRVKR